MARTRIFVIMDCDIDLGDMTSGQGHDTPLGNGQKLCRIWSWSNIEVKTYGPDTDLLCMHFDVDLGYIILGQGHDTLLDHGQ